MVSKNRRGPQAQVQISGQAMSSEAVVPPERKAVDWRNQLQADSRQRILNKIMETLKRHLPFSGEEGLQELKKIAETFEEKIYATSTSQSDYLRKISLKMLTMETTYQNPMANPLQLNTASNSENPRNPEYLRPFRAIMKVNSEMVVPSAGDWRNQLQADSRRRIINKIMESLKRHLPFSDEQGLLVLEKIAMRFEEKIYTAATSQSDYLRNISLKMLTMETKHQNPMANPLQLNTASNSENPRNPEYLRPFQAIMKVSSDVVVPSAGDWRNQLQADSRHRIINKITESLKRHLPFSDEQGLLVLEKIAVRFEEKIYTAATSQSDYLRNISLKMLTMETKYQNPMANPLQLDAASNSENP